MHTVGSRIRKKREEKGVSQEVMAMELELTQSSYGRLEKAANIIHHNNGDNAQASIGTVYSDKEHIQSLKEEIVFLRKLLEKDE